VGVVSHCVAEAFKALVRRPATTLLAVGSIALSLVLAGTVFLAGKHVSHASDGWARGAVVAVYLRPSATAEGVERLRRSLARLPGLHEIRFVDKKEALSKLEKNLGADARLLSGVEPEWLPASFEVTLRGSRAVLLDAQDRLTALGQALPTVEEVRTLRKWHRRLDSLASTLNTAAGVIVMLTLIVCGFVVAATVRLGLLARRREMRIKRLLGATRRLIAAPVLMEGGLQALMGSAAAAAALYVLHDAALSRFSGVVGSTVGAPLFSFVPWSTVAWGVGLTTLAGLLGSGLAVGKHAAAE
jgi:cell division transport system permease protein